MNKISIIILFNIFILYIVFSESCLLISDACSCNGSINKSIGMRLEELNSTCVILKYNTDSINLTQLGINELNDKNLNNILIITSKDSENNDKSDLWPTIIGGILAIAGGLLVAYWNSRNETKRNQFEWGKILYEKYEESYREFLTDLAGTTSGITIEEGYRKLCASSLVPTNLKIQIDETINLLKNGSLSMEEKEDFRNNLAREIEKFMQEPWKFK